jgi:hypothetical protein
MAKKIKKLQKGEDNNFAQLLLALGIVMGGN